VWQTVDGWVIAAQTRLSQKGRWGPDVPTLVEHGFRAFARMGVIFVEIFFRIQTIIFRCTL